MRFRQGGWSEFGIALFPDLLEHHIRRRRSLAKPVLALPKEPKKTTGKKSKPSSSESDDDSL